MPFFDFKCNSCGAEFSQLVFKETDKVECTKCFGHDVEINHEITHVSKNSGCLCCGTKGCTPHNME